MFLIFLFIFFLCWGSFLNVVAYRITYDVPFLKKRSFCPSCKCQINWYDNVPVISWILLKGRCRSCKKNISPMYPIIELISGILLFALFIHVEQNYLRFIPLFTLFSALIVSTRSDLEAMVIPQIFTLWLIPVGIVFSAIGAMDINAFESFIGAISGYFILWITGKIFKYIKKIDGIGVGDMELLAMIGSFIGSIGVWFTMLIGSILGLVIGGSYLFIKKKSRLTRIPFGPFLSLGAIIYIFFKSFLFNILF